MPYWRLSGFYFFYFALLGAMVPYWSLYLQDSGFSPAQIGLLGAIMMGTKVLSPYLWGWLADVTRQRMRVIRLGALFSALCFSFIFYSDNFAAMALVVGSFTFFWNAVLAQFEVVTLAYLRERFSRYSNIRVWGSVGFIVSVCALGWVFDYIEIRYLPHFMILFLVSMWLSSLFIDEPVVQVRREISRGLLAILKQPSVLAFFSVCFLMQLSHGPYYTFYSLYLEGYGFSRSHIGLLWALGVAAEVLVFLFMHKLLQHYSLRAILMFSLLVSVCRWLLIALFPQQLLLVLIAQLGHAATFGSFHAVAVEWVRRTFGEGHQGQGQALYSAVSFGAGGALGAVGSGFLWSYSQSLTWFLASAASILAALIAYRYFSDEGVS